MRGSTQLDGLWRVIVTRPLGVGCLLLLGLGASLTWAAVPLEAEQPRRAEVLVGRRLGRTPPMREYLATHPQPPNRQPRIIPPPSNIRPGAPSRAGGNGSAPGSLLTDPTLSTDSTASINLIGPVLQSSQGATNVSAPLVSFDAISTTTVPPDANISVGPSQIVEIVNSEFQVFDKLGNALLPNGPASLYSIFVAAVGGNVTSNGGCEGPGFGLIDPVVLFDKIDQRWIIGAAPATGPHYCLAISTSSDSTGSYDAYDIYFPPNVNGFPAYIDAAKLAIWADGSSWSSLGRYAGVYFSASQGVTCGFPLAQVRSPVSSLSWVCLYLPFGGSSLPFDLEGSPGVNNTTLPAPLGTPEYYAGVGSALLGLFQFAPDFSAGTATVSTQTFVPLAAKTTACEDQFGHQVEDCIPQSGTLNELEALGFTAMYRASYRNFGTRESMVVNESVQDNPASPQVGVRWYQLANTSPGPTQGPSAPCWVSYFPATCASGWSVSQQGTFSPDDGAYRWMGSIAQDKFGDLGLGYSTSSASTYPGIAYTGRTPSDPPNTLEAEYQALVGPAAQIATPRWGDYSSMSVDPTDDCTFWYVNEYVNSNLPNTQLGTHIVAFRLGDCEQIPFSSLSTKLAITAGPRPGFQMYANFTLGAGGSINPLTQPVTLQVGNYSVTVPPGSFKQLGQGSKGGNYVYSGTINGVSLQVHIVALGSSGYVFKAAAQPVDLTGLSSPVAVTVTIGNNSGTAEAAAELERRPAPGPLVNGGPGR